MEIYLLFSRSNIRTQPRFAWRRKVKTSLLHWIRQNMFLRFYVQCYIICTVDLQSGKWDRSYTHFWPISIWTIHFDNQRTVDRIRGCGEFRLQSIRRFFRETKVKWIMIKSQMRWLKSNGFAGTVIWSLDLDDFNGICPQHNGQNYPLMNAINEALIGLVVNRVRSYIFT